MPKPTAILLQYLAPQHFLSKLAGRLAYCRLAWFKNTLIQWFIRRYQVDMSIAAISDVRHYQHFNDFFTRRLQENARPIATDPHIACPCDGTISQIGEIKDNTLIQAKGHYFTTQSLLADDTIAPLFNDGLFGTFYLSPKDYHRVHMPLAGTLRRMTYIPGALYSVNALTAEHVPELFAQNERVVCLFETEQGPMVVVLVGAMIVGSMATTWSGTIKPHQPQISVWNYTKDAPTFKKGDEMGWFHLGSTAIVLLPKGIATWSADSVATKTVQMGEAIGSLIQNS